MISVLIAARNEFLLGRTIDSVLESAEGEIEVVVVLDGYWPEPIKDDPRVTLIHHTEPRGQRAAINEAARIARGKYILKTDAHSMFDKGFDVKLAADCEYDWTVIPTMYNLHAFDWVCGEHRFYQDKANPDKNSRYYAKKCSDVPKFELAYIYKKAGEVKRKKGIEKYENYLKKKQTRISQLNELIQLNCESPVKIEWVWKHRLHKKTDFMYMDKDLKVQYWYRYVKRKESKGDIVDIMNGVGACWFQHKDRFWELGGLDENHGSWGQVGVEVGCKAWLSGGRHVTNRKTWFAHVFRTTDMFSFPYPVDTNQQDEARRYSRDLWLKNNWPLAKSPFKWLLEKFQPIPSWEPIKLEKKPLLSVIIPARNEMYLQRTIDDCLEKLKTDFEIIVGLDGYEPELKKDPRVVLCHSKERIGMRPMINKMARMAKGKYLMRLDAHCIVDKGIDKELIGCYESGNTVLAMRYELKSSNWTRRDRTDCPYRYLSHPDSDEKGGLRGLAWPEWAKRHENEQIGETMTISGSNWLMEREQFLNWGGLDEQHGTFGQEGVEISCMTWLSGGRMLVNKNTWYAHWNRGKSSYALGANQKPKSMKRSIYLWMGDNWPHAKRKFQWLVDHFAPVPGWNDMTVIYVTSNREQKSMTDIIQLELLKSVNGNKIISVSQKPIDFGENICIGEVGRSSQNVLRQFLIGAERATTPYVAMAQSDCLYPPKHFTFKPTKSKAYYNRNILRLVPKKQCYLKKKSSSLCSLIGNRRYLIEKIKEILKDKSEWLSGLEHGDNKPKNLKDFGYGEFKTRRSIVNIHHNLGMHRAMSSTVGDSINTTLRWGEARKLIEKMEI